MGKTSGRSMGGTRGASFDASSAGFLEAMGDAYVRDASSVSQEWRDFFESLHGRLSQDKGAQETRQQDGRYDDRMLRASMGAVLFIQAMRGRGHYLADLDPLGRRERRHLDDLDPSHYGLDAHDDKTDVYVGGFLGCHVMTPHRLVSCLRRIYGGHIAVEYAHVDDKEQRLWLRDSMEQGVDFSLSREESLLALKKVNEGELFERFLHRAYTGTKRFSLEGGESLLVALEFLLKSACDVGTKDVVLGMAHRGRLNVLSHIMETPYETMFYHFSVNEQSGEGLEGEGDVKYHMGASADRVFAGKEIHVSLAANPSHLEVINPVVLGKVRAKQWRYHQRDDGALDRSLVLGVLVHGDAAFAGQGIVTETLDLSDLKGYRTGGTVHIIVNNQIGFTTSPVDARSSPYCSDHGKSIAIPIIHVNGDDVVQVVRAMKIASDYRYRFQRDVIVDMYCYRRHGHSEVDEPSFTQPLMYQAIRRHKTVRDIFAEELVSSGVITADDDKALQDTLRRRMQEAQSSPATKKAPRPDWMEGRWKGRSPSKALFNEDGAPLTHKELKGLAATLCSYPRDFHIHPKLKTLLSSRLRAVASGKGIDWATGELLAFASLLKQGTGLRLSGQDSARGTFGQRHAVLIDQKDGRSYMALAHVGARDTPCEILNSPLSEAGVLGFEYGYSLAEPHTLVIWEAQFGDFANGAQVMLDQFITASEQKWLRMSGLVLLLPHGYEGQGPDHSSARLERYLQACAQTNMVVANCTTPANYYHLLRRQMRRPFRRPLVIMAPKSLLRHKACVSSIADFESKDGYKRVLPELSLTTPSSVRHIVLCSGRVYYDVIERRDTQKINDVAVLRVEQLYPFPALDIEGYLRAYPHVPLIWCQEEPENMGAWSYIAPRLRELTWVRQMKDKTGTDNIFYVGRKRSAVTATGMMFRHKRELESLLHQVFHGPFGKQEEQRNRVAPPERVSEHTPAQTLPSPAPSPVSCEAQGDKQGRTRKTNASPMPAKRMMEGVSP
ncbi:MAG: 2-oxoglutarate dehydrogenase E1 component [Alphaproteobacteria bacterium GM7ARS4]|nr:2-oxoglutarate dehydrogenase E1 component [Alphaproteobacteria bacterium GM7ARS4]